MTPKQRRRARRDEHQHALDSPWSMEAVLAGRIRDRPN
jgi:hypothetical protein